METAIFLKMGELSRGLPKTAQRFVGEMLYGIQARQSVLLTEVARSLEGPIQIKKSHERLSRQLSRKSLAKEIENKLLARASKQIKDDTLLIIDPTDISKKYATKMQYLTKVRDGSTEQISDGYWVCSVVGAELEREDIIPIYQRLYSAEAPEFVSENDEILRCVAAISSYIGDRHLIFGGSARLAQDIAAGCGCPYSETVIKEEKGKERVFHIDFGFRKVFLPGHKKQLYLLVVKGFGQDPLMLLTILAYAGVGRWLSGI